MPDHIELRIEQRHRDAAADALNDMNVDWGACGDVRHGRVDHPLVASFAAFEASSKDAEIERLKAEKWDVKHADTMNDMVLMGLARDAAETKLAKAKEALDLFQSFGCPVCSGDCGSANPPVMTCPMEIARSTLSTLNDTTIAEEGE